MQFACARCRQRDQAPAKQRQLRRLGHTQRSRKALRQDGLRSHFSADRERLERSFLSDKLTVYRHLAHWPARSGSCARGERSAALKREEMYDDVERNPERAAIDDPRAHVPYSGSEASLASMLDRTGATGATGIATNITSTIAARKGRDRVRITGPRSCQVLLRPK